MFRLILPALIAAQNTENPGLTCTEDKVKTYVKLTQKQQDNNVWGTNEQ